MAVSDALPVVLVLAGPAAGRIRRHLEGELGWQPVEPDGPEPAPVRIVDVPGSRGLDGARTGHPAAVPTWLVVTPQDDPSESARAAARLGAIEVVPWPPEPGAFVAAAAALPDPAIGDDRSELRVGAASGGVGCTTVAMALAGLGAWAGRPTVVVTHGHVPHPVEATVEPESLRSPDVGRAARPVRGVPRLELLHVTDPAPDLTVLVEGRAVVRDLGTADPAVDVLVARRDPGGLAAVAESLAGTVVIADAGVVPLPALRRAAGGRRVVLLPWSVRVARAAVLGRVPASLPGAWLRTLSAVMGSRPQAALQRSSRSAGAAVG